VAAVAQRLAQLAEVVQLAVEDRRDRAVLVVDRLVTACHVDDGEPAHAERGVVVAVEAGTVRAPVDERVAHPVDQPGVRRAGRHGSRYPAHRRSSNSR
jgi:hypothetical protein